MARGGRRIPPPLPRTGGGLLNLESTAAQARASRRLRAGRYLRSATPPHNCAHGHRQPKPARRPYARILPAYHERALHLEFGASLLGECPHRWLTHAAEIQTAIGF